MTPEQTEQLFYAITRELGGIERMFKAGAHITLVVRQPHLPGDTSVVVTTDDIDAVIAELRKRKRDPGNEIVGNAYNPPAWPAPRKRK